MRTACLLVFLLAVSPSRAEDGAPAPVQAAMATPPPATVSVTPSPNPVGGDAKFSTLANWDTAGYNNDEIVYTIVVKNEDTRILRCTAQMKGSYIEKGQKFSIEDRQLATVFPDQRTKLGNWMGLDPASGATYDVKCRAL